MCKVSVIMPVYLGYYQGCASDRGDKFIRAINSFLNNDYKDKELIIISDNCELASAILKKEFSNELESKLIKYHKLNKKQKLFSGKLRTIGIQISSGDYIMYLDSDDMYGEKHISTVINQIKSNKTDWVYFNDYIMSESGLITKNVELEHGSIGTSSICHINNKKLNWRWCNGYGHDWKFIKKLIRFSENHEKIHGGTYIICHIPNHVDV